MKRKSDQRECLNPDCGNTPPLGKDICKACRRKLIEQRYLDQLKRERMRKAEYKRQKERDDA